MSRASVLFLSLTVSLFGVAVPAAADHTDPRTPIATVERSPAPQAVTSGEGEWAYITGFPPNPGTDLEIFKLRRRLFMSSGTLGGAPEQHVGQRMIKLLNRKKQVAVKWVADHGSSACATNESVATGLQHDASVARRNGVTFVVDTTDAGGPAGRCHDPDGGGLELIDVSKLHKKKKFAPREIHLTRHVGTSHNATVDATRPWIIYNSSSTFNNTAQAQIDVVDIRSCMKRGQTLEQRRKSCRPKVFRMQFQPGWTNNVDREGKPIEGFDSSCHDIVARPGRLYCAALSGTAIFDVRNIADKRTGAVKGKPLPCEVIEGTSTGAMVTDCAALATPEEGEAVPQATGWKFLGSFHHPGRDCGTGPEPGQPDRCNNNFHVPSREGVAVSHEAVPTPDGKYMFVTDERGGGIVPGGASCSQQENPYGNGGVHVFDISDPSKIEYAQTPDDQKAVFIGSAQVPAPTFCTAHRMELVPGEQRFFISWYSQGTKVVDYFFDSNGRIVFRETASYVPEGTQQWAVQPFKIVKNDDGTKTYYLVASDIGRGIDVFTWTGEPNENGTTPPPAELLPPQEPEEAASGVPLAVLALLGAAAAAARRRS